MTTSMSTPESTPAEHAVPIFGARDMDEIVDFYRRLGFTTQTYGDGGYLFIRRGGIELHYAHNPEIDPFSTAGMAFIRVGDAQVFYDEFKAANLWEPAIRGHELEAEVRRRWATGESIARIGAPEVKPWRVKEFPVLDPCNNLLRFGQSLAE